MSSLGSSSSMWAHCELFTGALSTCLRERDREFFSERERVAPRILPAPPTQLFPATHCAVHLHSHHSRPTAPLLCSVTSHLCLRKHHFTPDLNCALPKVTVLTTCIISIIFVVSRDFQWLVFNLCCPGMLHMVYCQAWGVTWVICVVREASVWLPTVPGTWASLSMVSGKYLSHFSPESEKNWRWKWLELTVSSYTRVTLLDFWKTLHKKYW